jgi:hypothetical protein
MTLEEHSSSAGRPELDLDEETGEERDESEELVAGGLCRLDAPTTPVDEDQG